MSVDNKVEQETVTPEQVCQLVEKTLDDHKAIDRVTLDIRGLTDIADYMVIASGGSGRQVKALANYLLEEAKKAGCPVISVEGRDQSEWVLVDLVDVVVHIMLPESRDLYRLEDIWSQPAGSMASPSDPAEQ